MNKLSVILLAVAAVATAQTTINGGRVILGRLDASGAASTSPMKVGTSLPGTCTVGDSYFKTDATAGQNLYGCTATNTWTQQAGGGGGGGGGSLTPPYACAVSTGDGTSKACTHNLSTSQPWVGCYDSSGYLLGSVGSATSVIAAHADSANAVTLTFAAAFNGTCVIASGNVGGDLFGPASATDNAVVRFDSTTGKLVQNSGVTVDDSANISTNGTLTTGASGGTSGSVTLHGSTGSAKVTVAAAAGTPADIQLPTATGSANTYLKTNGASPQVTSWAQPAFSEFSGNASVAQVKGSFSGTCDGTTYLRGDGACATPSGGGGGTVSDGYYFPWGGMYATNSFAIASGNGSKYASIWRITFPATMALKHITVNIATAATNNCGGGSSACGMVMALKPIALNANLCVTTVATGGGTFNINATGILSPTFASGDNVSSGTCTMSAGSYYLVATSDSAALAWATSISGVQQQFLNKNDTKSAGYSNETVATGDGATLAIPADITGKTWAAFGSGGVLPDLMMDGK